MAKRKKVNAAPAAPPPPVQLLRDPDDAERHCAALADLAKLYAESLVSHTGVTIERFDVQRKDFPTFWVAFALGKERSVTLTSDWRLSSGPYPLEPRLQVAGTLCTDSIAQAEHFATVAEIAVRFGRWLEAVLKTYVEVHATTTGEQAALRDTPLMR